MKYKMNAVAIILASGSGQRFGTKSVLKHLTPILGVPIIVWTLRSAILSNIFSSIIVVTRENDIHKTEEIYSEYFSDNISTIRITKGSNKRIQSFFCGLDDLIRTNAIVTLLDANRPFTPLKQLNDLYNAALQFGCSCPARPVVDGVAHIESNRIIDVPDKSSYVEFVTPEFIQFRLLRTSREKFNEGFNSIVEYALAIGSRPMTIKASSFNTKLTFPEDKTYLDGLALENHLDKPYK